MNYREQGTEPDRGDGKNVKMSRQAPFHWDSPIAMKDAFGKTYPVRVLDHEALYAPCIHINTRAKEHYTEVWPAFIKSMADAAKSVGIA